VEGSGGRGGGVGVSLMAGKTVNVDKAGLQAKLPMKSQEFILISVNSIILSAIISLVITQAYLSWPTYLILSVSVVTIIYSYLLQDLLYHPEHSLNSSSKKGK
jgi:hypothetical protein